MQEVAEIEVFLARLPDHGRGDDGVGATTDRVELDDRVVVFQRVVAVVIAEGSLRLAHVGAHSSDESDLRLSDEGVRADRVLRERESFADEERSEQKFADVLGERGDRRRGERGRSAEEHRHREGLIRRLRLVQVVAASLVDLPVDPEGLRAVLLHAVDPEVVALVRGVLGVDERPGEKGATVVGPTRDDRERIEGAALFDDFGDRPARAAAHPDAQQGCGDVARVPDLAQGRRDRGLGDVHQPFEELLSAVSEGELHPTRRSVEVRHKGELRALHIPEEERGSARRDDAAMDLGEFEIRIDLGGDLDDLVFAAELIDEASEACVHGGLQSGEIRNGPEWATAVNRG